MICSSFPNGIQPKYVHLLRNIKTTTLKIFHLLINIIAWGVFFANYASIVLLHLNKDRFQNKYVQFAKDSQICHTINTFKHAVSIEECDLYFLYVF